MPRPEQLIRDSQHAPPLNLVAGTVSTNKPAPASFTDPVYVVLTALSEDLSFPCKWGAIHGATFPARGASVVVAYPDNGAPVVVWWDGSYTP